MFQRRPPWLLGAADKHLVFLYILHSVHEPLHLAQLRVVDGPGVDAGRVAVVIELSLVEAEPALEGGPLGQEEVRVEPGSDEV